MEKDLKKGERGEINYFNHQYWEDDEIDLYELWLVLKKRRKIIFLTFFIFFLLSILYAFFSSPVYSLKHTYYVQFQSQSQLTAYVFKNILDSIKEQLKFKNFSFFEKEFPISKNEFNTISSFTCGVSRKDRNIFFYEIEGKNKKVLEKFDYYLKNYLKNSPVVKERLNNRKKLLVQTITLYEEKLSSLNKESRLIKNKIEKGNLKVLGFNPLDIDKTILEVESRVDNLKYQLKNLKPFSDVSVLLPDKPVKPKKKLIIAVASISGLFLGVFLAFFVEWLENAKKRYKEEGSN